MCLADHTAEAAEVEKALSMRLSICRPLMLWTGSEDTFLSQHTKDFSAVT